MFAGRALASNGLRKLFKQALSRGVATHLPEEPIKWPGPMKPPIESKTPQVLKRIESVDLRRPLTKQPLIAEQHMKMLEASSRVEIKSVDKHEDHSTAELKELAKQRLVNVDLLPPDLDTDAFKQRLQSARVFYNQEAFPEDNLTGDKAFSLERAITKVAAVDVAGSHSGEMLGSEWPGVKFFMSLKPGDSRGLSPEERVNAKDKIIASQAMIYQFGGYPTGSHVVRLKQPHLVYVFTMPGQQLEDPHLDYSQCVIDPYADSERYAKAHAIIENNPKQLDYTYLLTDVFPAFRYIQRNPMNGNFSTGFSKKKAVILDRAAYRDALEKGFSLLFSASEQMTDSTKPTYFKLPLMGMGHFAQLDGTYSIKEYLISAYFEALVEVLSQKKFGNLKYIEVPLFDDNLREAALRFADNKEELIVNGVTILFNGPVDVLNYSSIPEKDQYNLCALNPGDANSLPGNEFGFSKNAPMSVESAIGNNTDIRYVQNHLLNPTLTKKENWVGVNVTNTNIGFFGKKPPSSSSQSNAPTPEQEDLGRRRYV